MQFRNVTIFALQICELLLETILPVKQFEGEERHEMLSEGRQVRQD